MFRKQLNNSETGLSKLGGWNSAVRLLWKMNLYTFHAKAAELIPRFTETGCPFQDHIRRDTNDNDGTSPAHTNHCCAADNLPDISEKAEHEIDVGNCSENRFRKLFSMLRKPRVVGFSVSFRCRALLEFQQRGKFICYSKKDRSYNISCKEESDQLQNPFKSHTVQWKATWKKLLCLLGAVE